MTFILFPNSLTKLSMIPFSNAGGSACFLVATLVEAAGLVTELETEGTFAGGCA
jgi:hypothetical protein